MDQVIRFTDVDGVDKWTDVYFGPQGEGYIMYEEKVEDGVTMRRSRHTGPEQRDDSNWEWVKVEVKSLV